MDPVSYHGKALIYDNWGGGGIFASWVRYCGACDGCCSSICTPLSGGKSSITGGCHKSGGGGYTEAYTAISMARWSLNPVPNWSWGRGARLYSWTCYHLVPWDPPGEYFFAGGGTWCAYLGDRGGGGMCSLKPPGIVIVLNLNWKVVRVSTRGKKWYQRTVRGLTNTFRKLSLKSVWMCCMRAAGISV